MNTQQASSPPPSPTPTGALANLLTSCTILAAVIGIVGVIMALVTRTATPSASLHIFQGTADAYRTPSAIISNALALDARAIMQVAVIVLIATPVLRVAATGWLFLRRKEWTFVVVSVIVLAGLALGLTGLIE